MAEIFPFRPSEHESVQKLLPWFVNGTLSAHESGLVEAHISECDECHADLTLERQLAHDIATMPRNADDGWNALQSRLAIEAPRHVARGSYRLLRRAVPLGWAIASALFFAGCATVLGSKHYVRNILIGVVLSVGSFYAFYSGLGIPLPAGILDGIL